MAVSEWKTVNSSQRLITMFFSMSIKHLNAEFHNGFNGFCLVHFHIYRYILIFTDTIPSSYVSLSKFVLDT